MSDPIASSAANIHAHLRAAVRALLTAASGLPAIAWEGRPYQPIKGTPYLAEGFRPVSSVVRALGPGGTIAHTVIATFTLHYPAGHGTTAIDAAAGALLQLFKPCTILAYEGSRAVVQQAERHPLLQEPDWLTCGVVVTAVGHTSN